MKENEYVVLDDVYFTKVDGDKYIIEDKELSKLIVKYRCLEREYKNVCDCSKRYYKQYKERVKKYYDLAHTYKIELGRCRRKLTRIYRAFDTLKIEMLKQYIFKYDSYTVTALIEFIGSIKKLMKSI